MAGLGKEITEVGQDGSLLEEQNPSLSSVTSEPEEGPDRVQHVDTHSSENSGKIPL